MLCKDYYGIFERVERFNSYLDDLYYTGELKLSELQSFRKILDEIKTMFSKLQSLTLFGFIPGHVKKDIERLNSELLLMEYNLSLIFMNKLCAI